MKQRALMVGVLLAFGGPVVDAGPAQFRIDAIRASVGSREVADMLEAGRPLDEIERVVDAQDAAFASERAAFLQY